MMMSGFTKRGRGVSLIEALIALVVVSVGLLSITRLHGDLVASSGDSKARAEAIHLAKANNERLRIAVVDDQWENLPNSGSETDIEGVNATFDMNWTVDTDSLTQHGATFDVKVADTTVTWTDPRNQQQAVNLSTIVGLDSLRLAAASTTEGGGGGFVDPPSGRGIMGPDGQSDYDALPTGAAENLIDGEWDGTYTHQRDDGVWELLRVVDGDVEILMTMDGSDPDQGFSHVEGRIFFDSGWNQAPSPNEVYVLTSDAAFCTTLPRKEDMPNNINQLPDDYADYYHFNYRCYVGEGWYGNIGVVRLDNANPNDRVCVGDPAVTADPNSIYSRHPALSIVRHYRGYKQVGSRWAAVGIGMDNDGTYTAAQGVYVEHDFLLGRFGNNATDATCLSEMSGNPTPFVGNPGKYVCFGDDCGDAEPVTPKGYVFEGRIARDRDSDQAPIPELSDMTIAEASACSFHEDNQGQTHWYDYTCTLDLTHGYVTGDSVGDFHIEMSFTLGGLCDDNDSPGEVEADENRVLFSGMTTPGTMETINRDFTIREDCN